MEHSVSLKLQPSSLSNIIIRFCSQEYSCSLGSYRTKKRPLHLAILLVTSLDHRSNNSESFRQIRLHKYQSLIWICIPQHGPAIRWLKPGIMIFAPWLRRDQHDPVRQTLLLDSYPEVYTLHGNHTSGQIVRSESMQALGMVERANQPQTRTRSFFGGALGTRDLQLQMLEVKIS